MIETPVQVKDRTTLYVLLLGIPSLGLLLSEVVFNGFRELIRQFHERLLAAVPTYMTDVVGLFLITVAITMARRDFRTIGGTREHGPGSDSLKSLIALIAGVLGLIIILGGRFAGWTPGEVGILHVFAWPMLASTIILIATNRR